MITSTSGYDRTEEQKYRQWLLSYHIKESNHRLFRAEPDEFDHIDIFMMPVDWRLPVTHFEIHDSKTREDHVCPNLDLNWLIDKLIGYGILIEDE